LLFALLFGVRTWEVSLHAANKVVAGATFAKITPDRPPGPDAKASKVVAERRKAAAAVVAATARARPNTKAKGAPKPPPKK
jgi:hypothetical protein